MDMVGLVGGRELRGFLGYDAHLGDNPFHVQAATEPV